MVPRFGAETHGDGACGAGLLSDLLCPHQHITYVRPGHRRARSKVSSAGAVRLLSAPVTAIMRVCAAPKHEAAFLAMQAT